METIFEENTGYTKTLHKVDREKMSLVFRSYIGMNGHSGFQECTGVKEYWVGGQYFWGSDPRYNENKESYKEIAFLSNKGCTPNPYSIKIYADIQEYKTFLYITGMEFGDKEYVSIDGGYGDATPKSVGIPILQTIFYEMIKFQ